MQDQILADYFNKDISHINKEYDDQLYLRARNMRRQLAQEIFEANLEDEIASIDIENGMLKSILERTPFDNTRRVLQFNILLTRRLTQRILSNREISRFEKIGLYAYVVELGYREFFSPDDASTFLKHLGAAKDRGFFFTPPSVAVRMVALSLKYGKNITSLADPACGVGVFLAYSMLFNHNIKKVVGIELDGETAAYAKDLLYAIARSENLDVEITVCQGDFFDYVCDTNAGQFDFVVMNPPYGSGEFLASDLDDVSTRTGLTEEEKKKLEQQLRNETISKSAKLRSKCTSYGMAKGTLELSKLFMGAVHQMLSDNGIMVSITPSTWLGDETSKEFRKEIIGGGYLRELWLIPEKAKLFKGVNQPTAISVIGKSKEENVKFANDVLDISEAESLVSTLKLENLIKVAGDSLKFPKCRAEQLEIFAKLHTLGSIGNISNIVNARGELDLTVYKAFVSEENTGHRLIRGDHINNTVLGAAEDSTKAGYVRYEEFVSNLKSTSKLEHILYSRIALPQCSYLQKAKRIEAAIIPEGSVVANSCNYILVRGENRIIEEFYYWMVINSNVIEWEFRIFSYNNHVSNSEINVMSCIPYDELGDDTKLFIQKLFESNSKNIYFMDAYIAFVFGLSLEEYSIILNDIVPDEKEKYIIEFMNMDNDKEIPQHNMPSLSELDKEMISYVEPGGNWTSIPETVPSKRLDQIREMARTRGMVRTTYYSRLRYDQPSYTISTFFNRPGNGANTHPWEDRTLSSREAARLQSFPDDFVFEGNEAAIRTQIGNAVPPLLGYAIGKAIEKKAGEGLQFCDVFAGAGGLSYGLEMAGFEGIAALELNKHAAATFKRNHSQGITTFVGDINELELQEKLLTEIMDKKNPNKLWVLVGGPPCQGFSTAGYRDENDIRNKLVDTYLDFINKARPSIVVMENVVGILSMSKGQVIKGVYESLGKLGYHVVTQPWIVDAERYGVPQMRRRVIIVAAREEQYLPDYPETLFQKCLGRREDKQMQLSFETQRYPVTVGEALLGLPPLMPINKYYPEGISIDTIYSEWCSGKISTEQFLKERSKM